MFIATNGYKGNFVNGRRNGIGKYHWDNDVYYIGEWIEDKKEGVATIYNQNCLYRGSVKNGIKDGYATFIFEDNIYTGPFKDNMWEGYGTLIMSKESDIFEGYLKRGEMPKKKSLAEQFEQIQRSSLFK